MTHTMKIHIDGSGWVVTDNDPSVVKLFGTDTLPLPFLSNVPASLVIDTLERLNPDARIVRI